MTKTWGKGGGEGRRTSGSLDMHADVHAVYFFCDIPHSEFLCTKTFCVWVTFAIWTIKFAYLTILIFAKMFGPSLSFHKVPNNNNDPFIQGMYSYRQSYFCGAVRACKVHKVHVNVNTNMTVLIWRLTTCNMTNMVSSLPPEAKSEFHTTHRNFCISTILLPVPQNHCILLSTHLAN